MARVASTAPGAALPSGDNRDPLSEPCQGGEGGEAGQAKQGHPWASKAVRGGEGEPSAELGQEQTLPQDSPCCCPCCWDTQPCQAMPMAARDGAAPHQAATTQGCWPLWPSHLACGPCSASSVAAVDGGYKKPTEEVAQGRGRLLSPLLPAGDAGSQGRGQG